MFDNIDNMARIEREIEKRMEAACEKSLAHVGTSKRVQGEVSCPCRHLEARSGTGGVGGSDT